MNNQNSFWCIVAYAGPTPFYYTGWYCACDENKKSKPCLSLNFGQAMKLHSKEEAIRILSAMAIEGWKVEEHAWI